MKLSSLTFILTDRCNWNCSYCFQRKRLRTLDRGLLSEACAFFYPRLGRRPLVSFYGGEPLLAFEAMGQAVEDFQRLSRPSGRRLRFSITTNGSLMTDDRLAYLDQNSFEVLLSFDGLAQEHGRKAGSFRSTLALLEKLLDRRRLRVMTNSVFTPRTVGLLADSLQLIAESGVRDIRWTISSGSSWTPRAVSHLFEQVERLRRWLLRFYEKEGRVPLTDFLPSGRSGVFCCSAGRDRMTLAADGNLWGCYLFADYANAVGDGGALAEYGFGRFDHFIKNHQALMPRTLERLKRLRGDAFYTDKGFCIFCKHIGECSLCPLAAAMSGTDIGFIPLSRCRVSRGLNHQRRRFWKSAGLTPA